MNASKVFWRGVVCALAGATLWGFSGACIQFLAESYEVSSAFISAVRAGVAALLFAVFVFVTRREALLSLLGSPAARPTLVLFGVGLYLSQITYAVSVALTNAGTATVLQATCTVFVMLITCVRARRLPRVADFVGLMCAMAAATLIATQGDWGVIVLPVAGLAWGIANALSETLYIMAPQRLYGRWDRPTIIACGMVIGGVAAVLVWLIGEAVVSLLAPSVGLGPAFASPGSDTALSTTVQASSGSGAGVSFADSAPGAPSSVLADIFGIGGSHVPVMDAAGWHVRRLWAVPLRRVARGLGEGEPSGRGRAGRRHDHRRDVAAHPVFRRRLGRPRPHGCHDRPRVSLGPIRRPPHRHPLARRTDTPLACCADTP